MPAHGVWTGATAQAGEPGPLPQESDADDEAQRGDLPRAPSRLVLLAAAYRGDAEAGGTVHIERKGEETTDDA
ncbi:hypothetical protein [Actinomadura sediminis]|uniref:Uncharacterized protein n=1 Tax=Actinomadura sediminis TaxID=1038904 RepID=A0ABW3EK12_9ACTN